MEPTPEYWTENVTHNPTWYSSIWPLAGNNADSLPSDELAAWDELSDDALSNFEQALQSEGPDLEIMCDALLLCLKIFNRVVLPRLADEESRHPPRKPLWAVPKAPYEGERNKA